MAKVVWTQRALSDLEGIGEYISKDSFKYAAFTLEKLINTESLIESNLFIGRIVPEINNKLIREIIKGNYRVIYQIRNDSFAYILSVFHSARLLTESDLI